MSAIAHYHNKLLRIGGVAAVLISGAILSAPAFAANPYYPLYYTAGYGGNLNREHAPFQLPSEGIFQSNVTTGTTTTVSLRTKSSKTSGFVVEGGELGSLITKQAGGDALSMVQVKGTGTFSVNLWVDSNTANDSASNGDWFSWSGPLSSSSSSSMTLEGGDQVLTGPTESSQILVNGKTTFQTPNGPYTLNQLQSGQDPSIAPTDNIAVWIGVTKGTATISDVKINSTPIPLGQLPEVPYAAALPLVGGVTLLGVAGYRKNMVRAKRT